MIQRVEITQQHSIYNLNSSRNTKIRNMAGSKSFPFPLKCSARKWSIWEDGNIKSLSLKVFKEMGFILNSHSFVCSLPVDFVPGAFHSNGLTAILSDKARALNYICPLLLLSLMRLASLTK